MKSTADRIIQKMYELNITQADIKRATGAGKATISSWVHGNTKPSGIYASKLATCLCCSTDWLLVGDKENNYKVDDLPVDTTPNVEDNFIEYKNKGMTPIISWIVAASFSNSTPMILNQIVDWTPSLPHLSAKSFGLIIQGRSMWPDFKPKEIIYVEPNIALKELKDGDLVIVLCHDDKQANFKQVVIGEGKGEIYLKPFNPDLPYQTMQPIDNFSLIGIVDSKLVKYR